MPRKTIVTDPAVVAQRVREVRESLGLTIREAAERCGVGWQTWSDLERGKRGDGSAFGVSLDRLYLIAESLGVDPRLLDHRFASVVPKQAGKTTKSTK